MGDRRCRRKFVSVGQHQFDAIGSQHLDRAGICRRGQRMRVEAEEQRAGDALGAAVIAQGLRDGEHVPLVEGAVEGRATVSRGAKGHPL